MILNQMKMFGCYKSSKHDLLRVENFRFGPSSLK